MSGAEAETSQQMPEQKKAALISHERLFEKINSQSGLPTLRAGVVEVGLCPKLCGKLGKTIPRVHFNAIVLSATCVWWLEGSVVCWAKEGEELETAIA
jgi:hypothetical protein